MLIDRIIYPIKSLGPGRRLVIWTVGCSKHCKGCANPELWLFDKNKEISIDRLYEIILSYINNEEIDGVTISGGDPFEQLPELLYLLKYLSQITDDIIVYTGFSFEELSKLCSEDEMKFIKQTVTLLIDGKYIEELNDNKCQLRGSTNQKLIFFNNKHRKIYEDYIKQKRIIQNVYYENKLISVGIHNYSKEK